MLDIDVKNGLNLALRSQFLPPIAIVRQAASSFNAYPVIRPQKIAMRLAHAQIHQHRLSLFDLAKCQTLDRR